MLFFILQKAAIFWWNLHRNGQGDVDTLHAGCPVLIGDKWGKFKIKVRSDDLFSRSQKVMEKSQVKTINKTN